jgi:multicomponent Na+:H+ antiporter subunit E
MGLTFALATTWALLSGHTEPLIVAFGLLSVAAVVALSWRMKIIDDEGVPLDIHTWRLLGYLPWLLWQLVLSNLEVSRRILSPRLDIDPKLVTVLPSQRTYLGRVFYANSITLTPGTVSVRMYEDEILVHALHPSAADDLTGSEMDRRITHVERRV